jgi:DNA-binding MarR family transcriptional regulator
VDHLVEDDYRTLLQFRTELRRFLHWSEQQARDAGLSPAQHQLLLAVRGHPDAKGPTVNEVAEHLVLRQNSAVELIDRAEAAGYVNRVPDPSDRRIVHIRLTPAARGRLTRLAKAHLEELRRLGPRIHGLVAGLDA